MSLQPCYVSCSECDRTFNKSDAERHAAVCRHIKERPADSKRTLMGHHDNANTLDIPSRADSPCASSTRAVYTPIVSASHLALDPRCVPQPVAHADRRSPSEAEVALFLEGFTNYQVDSEDEAYSHRKPRTAKRRAKCTSKRSRGRYTRGHNLQSDDSDGDFVRNSLLGPAGNTISQGAERKRRLYVPD